MTMIFKFKFCFELRSINFQYLLKFYIYFKSLLASDNIVETNIRNPKYPDFFNKRVCNVFFNPDPNK